MENKENIIENQGAYFSPEEIMVVEDVLQVLRTSRVQLYRMLKKKEIPFHRIGKIYYFNRSRLAMWMQQNGKI